MGKVFLNKQFSNYLGENRAILDTVVSYVSDVTPSPTPSVTVTPTVTATPTSTPTPTPSSIPSFDPDYQAILNYATGQGWTLPTDGQKTLQNQLLVDLKNVGIWNDLDIFYVCATDGDANYAKINWKNPGNFTLVENGVIDFVVNEGLSPNTASLSNYVSTQFNPAINGSGYTLDDASRFIWDFDGSSGGAAILDGVTGSTANLMISNISFVQRINQGSTNLNTASYDNTGVGLKMISRTSNTNVNMWINGSLSSFPGTNSTAIVSDVQVLFRRSSSGSGDMTASAYGMGASLSGKENDLYNSINTYMTSI